MGWFRDVLLYIYIYIYIDWAECNSMQPRLPSNINDYWLPFWKISQQHQSDTGTHPEVPHHSLANIPPLSDTVWDIQHWTRSELVEHEPRVWGLTVCLLLFYTLSTSKDRHRIVTVHTHGDFIVLLHCKIRPPAPWIDSPLSHIILTLSQPVFALSW